MKPVRRRGEEDRKRKRERGTTKKLER